MPLTRIPVRLALLLMAWFNISEALADNASMTLYVFKKGLPVANIEVLVDSAVVGLTNEQGVVRLNLEPGIHAIELREQDRVVLDQQVLAHQAEISQWIVNITRGLSALTDMESSFSGADALPQAADDSPALKEPGQLAGKLVSAEDGKPIEGARIFISGQTGDIRSDSQGDFKFELPSGVYSVSVLHSGFNTSTWDHIEVPPGEATSLTFELTPSGSELPEFVVIEPYIAGSLASVLEERRSDQNVANIIGSEQISKAGDSDAASALRRVTGLTLVDGRFIYIRGLGERYSSTLLNGANVPSPDATRRVVPLDLFPTGIVDSIAVKKGYVSSLPGEFGGGAVEIRTRSMPEAGFFNVEYSMGYIDGTTGQTGLGYAGGGKDWTGYDDGTREQPPLMADTISDGTQLQPFNRFTGRGILPGELELIGESLPVNWDVTRHSTDPNLGLTGTGGDVWQFDNGARLGFLAAGNYQSNWNSLTESRTDFVNAGGGVLESQNDFTIDSTVRSLDLSGFLTVGAELGENHLLSFNWMLLRNTTDKTQVEQGFNKDADGGDVRFTELEWTEREMAARQLHGEHRFKGLRDLSFNWQYTTATASSDAPDTRRYRYDPDTLTEEQTDFIFSIRNDSNQRRWSELEDDSDSWNADFAVPIKLSGVADMTLLLGFSGVEKSRNSEIRRFSYRSRGPLSGSIALRRNLSVEDIINAATIAPDGWQLEEVTIATDSYTARQDVEAWHAGFDMNFGESVRLAGGVRDEQSAQSVSTFNLFDPERNPVVSTLDTKDTFPYLSATWYRGSHQLRVAYGETVNRPDFKELSESLYKDPILDRLVKGNPGLDAAFITHYDIRWDYYFNQGEFISLGVFKKEFERPIESVILASADTDLTSFNNAEAAENIGFEFELYKTLEFLNRRWGWGPIWERFYLSTNYAWIDSDITLTDDNAAIQTSSNRPLQGQSPYVVNLQLGFDDEDRQLNAALLYNVFGERIVDVGVSGAPDIYEQPRGSLDFVYSQSIGNWKLKAKLRNLLDPDRELTQGIETTRISRAGRELSFGLEYSFR